MSLTFDFILCSKKLSSFIDMLFILVLEEYILESPCSPQIWFPWDEENVWQS